MLLHHQFEMKDMSIEMKMNQQVVILKNEVLERKVQVLKKKMSCNLLTKKN